MNYIIELNAFRNWLLLNEILTSAIAVVYVDSHELHGWLEE
ncbi:hypothetical protein QGM71_19900 [Virgibacillus sp. C22-A2]|uniref:Uncharacterized protein n=1 Tax=Virgibacillus tibetensis TaxID=3042313 RepID=A0ABU6KK97_9BACI|nr:hypothetical protein [Virgibacillus sp. C22-A2]